MSTTYKERIEREISNTDCVYAYSDGGLFYNFYDRSAYVLHTCVKKFKTSVKTLKGLTEPYIMLGFPVSKKEDYLASLGDLSKPADDHSLIVWLHKPIDLEGYQRWRNEILFENMSNSNKSCMQGEDSEQSNESTYSPEVEIAIPYPNLYLNDFADEVLSLNLASTTPMEALLFLNDLQRKLREEKNKQ